MITYRPATGKDFAMVIQLLGSNGLPSVDIPVDLENFIVAHDGALVAGCIGLEVRGDHGLIRSLAVRSELQGQGIGTRLYKSIIEEAKRAGVKELHLLTTSAQAYFQHKGFHVSERNESPDEISTTKEFTELCPSTAVYMVRKM